MKVHIMSKRVNLDETVRGQIERRVQSSFGRFSHRIVHVKIQLVDINGPKGGEDKACKIEVRLKPSGVVLIKDVDVEIYAVINRAIDRAGRSVARSIKKSRSFEREPARSIGSVSAPF